MKLALLLIPALLGAQPMVIALNCGGPQIPSHNADQYFKILAFPNNNPAEATAYSDTAMGQNELTTLRFAPSFNYRIPLPLALYRVVLRMVEPNKTAIGQRVFTVDVNGQTSDPIDLFKLRGLKQQFILEMMGIVGNGYLTITFKASVGNALVNAIEVFQVPSAFRWQTIYPCIQVENSWQRTCDPAGVSANSIGRTWETVTH